MQQNAAVRAAWWEAQYDSEPSAEDHSSAFHMHNGLEKDKDTKSSTAEKGSDGHSRASAGREEVPVSKNEASPGQLTAKNKAENGAKDSAAVAAKQNPSSNVRQTKPGSMHARRSTADRVIADQGSRSGPPTAPAPIAIPDKSKAGQASAAADAVAVHGGSAKEKIGSGPRLSRPSIMSLFPSLSEGVAGRTAAKQGPPAEPQPKATLPPMPSGPGVLQLV